jgi:hypothetical protein
MRRWPICVPAGSKALPFLFHNDLAAAFIKA